MRRFSNILIGAESRVDNSAAFDRALRLADNNHAHITVIGAVDVAVTERAKALREAMIDEQRDQLQAVIQGVSSNGTNIETKVLVGKAFVEIIWDVVRNGRDLIIKSVDRSGSQPFGSTDMKVLRKCPCRVWMIRSTQQQGYRGVLAALHYDPENLEKKPLNRQILKMVSSLALSEFGGTVGRTGIPGFVIGNMAEHILKQIVCFVLAIKPAGFISPVTADSAA